MPATLFEEHRAIIIAMEDIIAAAMREPRVGIDELNRMRARLAKLIKAHRLSEEQRVLGPLFAMGGAAALPEAARAVEEAREMWISYSQHVRTWTPSAIQADWQGYAKAVADGLVMVKHMTAHEEAKVYRPVLDLIAARAQSNRAHKAA